MTKAKKGLIITLFAAMMVFAFGATSAFAAEGVTYTGKWINDYAQVEVTDSTGFTYTYNTTREFQTNGKVVAYVDQDTSVSWHVPTKAELSKEYYDFNYAQPADSSGAIKSVYLNGGYIKGQATRVLFSAPNYVTEATKTITANPVKLSTLENGGTWEAEFVGDEDYEYESIEDQIFTLSLDVKYNTHGDAERNPVYIGQIPAKEVKVLKRAPEYTDIKFYQDKIDGAAAVKNNLWTYDGNEHTLVASEVEGFTVTWAEYNKTTGEYDAVGACPVVKDVMAKRIQVKATISWVTTTTTGSSTTTTTNTHDEVFTLKVDTAAPTPKYAFAPGNDGTSSYTLTAAQAADPTAWVVLDNGDIDADKEELKAVFNELYTVKVTKNAIDENIQEWTFGTVDDFDAALEASEKAHETLFANYGIMAKKGLVAGANNKVRVTVVDTNYDEINFTNAPNMTYKVKKAKKLKKTKSFTVAAVAKSGKTVTYTIDSPSKKIAINAATGKVTVKKGLKKGSYKVIVKAHTEAGNGYQAGYAERALTIKIKK
jgi:hypothetical protein